MPNVDLDDEFLKLFYGITNSTNPVNISLQDLKSQLSNIVNVIKDLNSNSKKPFKSKVLDDSEQVESASESNPAILVVDDLGVITYQLKVLLSRFKLDIDCSQEIYDAVNKYKKRKYMYVVMDLFIPTEREGFILLTELKKLAQLYNVRSIVGVITASPRKEIEQECKVRRADFFLAKNNEWQANLLEVMGSYINVGDKEEDDL
jgi:CheY-like chemotaxis protein